MRKWCVIQAVMVLEEWWAGEGRALQVDPKEWGKGERAELPQPHSSGTRPCSVPLGREWGVGQEGKRKMSSLLTMHFIQTLPLFFKFSQNVSGNGTLFIHLAWNMMCCFYLLPSPSLAPERCLIFNVFLSYFFIDLLLVLHSGKAPQVHTRVIDWLVGLWFFAVLILSFFTSKSGFKFCCFPFRYILVSPVYLRSNICASGQSSASAPSFLGLSVPFLHLRVFLHCLLTFSTLFFWLLK